MGQQQLLLVILVTILVGIATVVAINVFGTAAEEANRDAVRQDLLQAAAAAQAIYTKPTALGGAQRNFQRQTETPPLTLRDIMSQLNIAGRFVNTEAGATDPNWINENAEYEVAVENEYSLLLTAVPTSWSEDILMRVCRDGVTRTWEYEITTDGGTPTLACAAPPE